MKTNETRVVNLSNNEDINAYMIGEYINTGMNRWVNFGKNNDYPSYLRTLYLSSPTNQAIIDGTTNLATGEGIEVVNPEQNPLSNKWLNDNFPKDVVKKLISDLKLYGYCAVEVYDGKIVKHQDAIKFRFDCEDEHGNINYVWFSNDWDYYNYKRNKPVKLPMYTEGSEEPISILICQLDKHGFDYYSPVDYAASINYISLESEISKYHLSNIKNGLFPSMMMNIIGSEFSDEQMDAVERNINRKFSGSSNTGRVMLNFIANKEDATTVTPIEQNNLSETYQFLTKECSEKILIGHNVTSPLLFGIRDSSGLGNNAEELEQSFYLFFESKLKHYQNYIIDMIKKVMNGNLLYADIQFITYNPFAVKDTTTKMSKVTFVNETSSQELLNKIDSLAVKNEDIIIDKKLFTNVNSEKLYTYVKSSNVNNIINKKFEILAKQGYVFKGDEIIKNSKDGYFLELVTVKKI